jgi:Holliday junction resolvase RusA-like endonuclease
MMLPPLIVSRLSPNSRAQSHWPRTRARQRVMEHTSIVARVQGLRPVRVPVEVTFRWVVPNRIKRDIDNLAGNGVVKAVLDALVADKYLVDDSSQYVTAVRTEMVHEIGSRYLEIVIAPAPDGPAAGG